MLHEGGIEKLNMKTFEIEIKETLSRVISINAENLNEAILKTQHMYSREKIVLDAEDHYDTSFYPVTNNFEIEKIMQKDFDDERDKLKHILIHIGFPENMADIISIEAGSSQAIVNEEYLHDVGSPVYLFEKAMCYINMFYRGELSSI